MGFRSSDEQRARTGATARPTWKALVNRTASWGLPLGAGVPRPPLRRRPSSACLHLNAFWGRVHQGCGTLGHQYNDVF